ncbi:MAG TPA: phosphatase PAP2 family protein [Actinomycetota bacterium]
MLELSALAAISVIVGVAWMLVVRAVPHADPAERVSRRIGERLGERRRVRMLLRERLDPETATGLGLSLALLAVAATGIVFGVFIVMIRQGSGVVNVDAAVTRWAAAQATSTSLTMAGWITWAGSTIVIVAAALATAAFAVRRWSRWSPALFLAVVVVGQFVLSNVVKAAVGRIRPDAPPFHVLSGPSFPSGHSTAAAATWGAIALVLGRGTPVRWRAALAGGAATLATAVACSRVFLGAHWTSDAVGGLVLGWTWFAVCAVAFGGRILRLGRPAEPVAAPRQRPAARGRRTAA